MHAAGIFFIVLFVLLIAGAVGWVVFTQLRARRLGLPPPSLSSYNPFNRSDHHSPYGPPEPASGGIGAWFSDKIRGIRGSGGNKRSATGGGYEQSRRGFGPLDPDEAWDTRVGNEADMHYGPGGYYEEQELGMHGSGAGGASSGGGPYGHSAYASAGGDHQDRGRTGGRAPAATINPFDDDSAEPSNLRGVSPRPIDTSVASNAALKKPHGPSSGSPNSERRSIFREDVA
ncbi:hypothetical protein Micbo1qcDRAFT_162403 [Microdochium bolleyi]|uniref:Acid phosphatase-like protein n=1 Tax=Microdochium bolleyi TaxID=196109 RepID=A0A136J542_9PEZI|nr:hypothetical protein Micbo1qcDRAFT_162403 [Microdochium bolleyi]